jgi:hypothetical protein
VRLAALQPLHAALCLAHLALNLPDAPAKLLAQLKAHGLSDFLYVFRGPRVGPFQGFHGLEDPAGARAAAAEVEEDLEASLGGQRPGIGWRYLSGGEAMHRRFFLLAEIKAVLTVGVGDDGDSGETDWPWKAGREPKTNPRPAPTLWVPPRTSLT